MTPHLERDLKIKTRKTIVVFDGLLRSIAAAGSTVDAAGYELSTSGKARNAKTHRVNGNVRRAKKVPKCVEKLRGHDRARASLCAGCDRYISGQKWHGRSKIGAVSLLDRPEQAAKVRACIPTFRLTNRALGTSACTACIAMFTERSRGYDNALHTEAHDASVERRLLQCVTGVPCEQEGAKDGDCEIRSRAASFLRGSNSSPTKR